jgi:hypothetical protein
MDLTPSKVIINWLFAATGPPLVTLKVIIVVAGGFVQEPIVPPLNVIPVIALSVNPAGKVIVTEALTLIAALGSFSTFAFSV